MRIGYSPPFSFTIVLEMHNPVHIDGNTDLQEDHKCFLALQLTLCKLLGYWDGIPMLTFVADPNHVKNHANHAKKNIV